MHVSHDRRETFVRVSHDSRANVAQFYFSQSSREMVLFMWQSIRICIAYSWHCADHGNLVAMCPLRVGHGLAPHAMTWRSIFGGFLSHKKV